MDKGIRVNVNAKFAELLPQVGKELTARSFRKAVMQYAMSEFSVSIASAASHYNHALKAAKAADPAAVEGIGRTTTQAA